MKDLVSTCRNHGVEVPNPPTKAASYTNLIKELESLGVVAGDPGSEEGSHGPQDLDDVALHVEHRDSVSNNNGLKHSFLL